MSYFQRHKTAAGCLGVAAALILAGASLAAAASATQPVAQPPSSAEQSEPRAASALQPVAPTAPEEGLISPAPEPEPSDALEQVAAMSDRDSEVLAALTAIGSNPSDGYRPEVMPEEAWLANDPDYENWWNPMEVIEQGTIPVLAFFGEKDTQVDPIQGARAYREALERAGNSNSRVELIPGVDHAMILAETGCYDELTQMVQSGNWTIAPEFLDTQEEWLRDLRR